MVIKKRSFILAVVIGFIVGTNLFYTRVFAATSTPPAVRFVFLCASDRCDSSLGGLSAVNAKAYTIKAWYKGQMGGRAFKLLPTIKVTSRYSEASYRNGSNSSSAINTVNRLYDDPTMHEQAVKRVYVMGFNSMDHCGASPAGDIAAVNPFRGCGSFLDAVDAHELGHSWGLGHRRDGSLMQDRIACNGRSLSNCSLNASQQNFLLTSRSAYFSYSN